MAMWLCYNFFLGLTFETMGEGVHLHLKGIFQKQHSSD